MRAQEFIKDWMVMPYTAKPMGLKKANGHWEPINPSPKRGEGNKVYTGEDAPPGREKQVKALKGKVDNPYAVAWASYNKSKN